MAFVIPHNEESVEFVQRLVSEFGYDNWMFPGTTHIVSWSRNHVFEIDEESKKVSSRVRSAFESLNELEQLSRYNN